MYQCILSFFSPEFQRCEKMLFLSDRIILDSAALLILNCLSHHSPLHWSAKHPSNKRAFESVTSYCSWNCLQLWEVNPISL